MRKVARKSLVTAIAAGGALAATAGYAHADAGAQGSTVDSSGIGSGNNVQVPVHAPINLCGNTVNVIGWLNPAAANACSNGGGANGAAAVGSTQGSGGVLSGNNVQVPIDVPVNVCGNSINVVGGGNAAYDNTCTNGGGTPTPTPTETPEACPDECETPEPCPVACETPEPCPDECETPTPEPTCDDECETPEPCPVACETPEPCPDECPVDEDTSRGQHGQWSEHGSHAKGSDRAMPHYQELAHTGSSASLALVIPASAGLLFGGAALYRRSRTGS